MKWCEENGKKGIGKGERTPERNVSEDSRAKMRTRAVNTIRIWKSKKRGVKYKWREENDKEDVGKDERVTEGM